MGFIAGLIVALFIMVDNRDLFVAIGIGAVVGLAFTTIILLLERRFPDEPGPAD